MKTIALCVLCMLGAIIAYHDTPLFVSSTPWLIATALGLLIILCSPFMPDCMLSDAITSMAIFVSCIGVTMSIATFCIERSATTIGLVCGFFTVVYAVVARFIFCLAHNADDHDEDNSSEWSRQMIESDEAYSDDHPA